MTPNTGRTLPEYCVCLHGVVSQNTIIPAAHRGRMACWPTNGHLFNPDGVDAARLCVTWTLPFPKLVLPLPLGMPFFDTESATLHPTLQSPSKADGMTRPGGHQHAAPTSMMPASQSAGATFTARGTKAFQRGSSARRMHDIQPWVSKQPQGFNLGSSARALALLVSTRIHEGHTTCGSPKESLPVKPTVSMSTFSKVLTASLCNKLHVSLLSG